MKKLICTVMALVMILSLASVAFADDAPVYKVGLCTWTDHASSNQILDNIVARLEELEAEYNVVFDVDRQNANADASTLEQIIANFVADEVDVMVGEATPVATAMQTATEDNQIPVIFAAVSDPAGSGIVDSMEAPGANLTGTSDYLNTAAVMDLLFTVDPEADLIGMLYDIGQESSTAFIAEAEAYLDEKNIEYKEYTGSSIPEIQMAVQQMIDDGVDAAFTPTDNTIQDAELSIYEDMAEAGIAHYTGADSFALNGAFLGYGVDYANLGVETANMVADLLVNGADPAETPVMTFDNGIATINSDVCEQITGKTFEELQELLAPMCTAVNSVQTAEEFE